MLHAMTWNLFDAVAQQDQRTIQAILGPPRTFDTETAAALREALPAIDTRPQTVEAADRAQNQLIDLFNAHGHRAAAFLVVYHGITVAVIDALAHGKPHVFDFGARNATGHRQQVCALL
jgi:hypothetical protein